MLSSESRWKVEKLILLLRGKSQSHPGQGNRSTRRSHHQATGPRILTEQIPQLPQDRPYLPPFGNCRLRIPAVRRPAPRPSANAVQPSIAFAGPMHHGVAHAAYRPGRARGTRRGRINLMHGREQSRSRSARDSSRNRARCPPLKPRLAARALPSDLGRACRRPAYPGRGDQGCNHVFARAYRHDPFTPQAHPSRQQPLAVDRHDCAAIMRCNMFKTSSKRSSSRRHRTADHRAPAASLRRVLVQLLFSCSRKS